MSEIDNIKQVAQQALTAQTIAGATDKTLWDRAQRLVRNIEHICQLPEIMDKNLSIDRFCLMAAAYFTDASFAYYPDAKNTSIPAVLVDINTIDLRNFSAQAVTDKLTDILTEQKIDKINKIIIESGNRLTNMTEAMILSDARNLDDLGTIGVFNEFRRYVTQGRSVSDALQSWKKKIDYHYWQARLKESFHFESVREIAARRFSAAEEFMNQLLVENTGKDLEQILIGSF